MRVTKVSAPPRPGSNRRPLGGMSMPGGRWRRRRAERAPAPGALEKLAGPILARRLKIVAIVGVAAIGSTALGAPSAVLRAAGDGLIGLSAAAGFTVETVTLEGRIRSDADAVRDALHVEIGDPLFGVALTKARRRLERLPWVASAAVERRPPQGLRIVLTERLPLARWQRDGETVRVVDRDGAPIEGADVALYSHLPLLVGEDATAAADDLFALLATQPALAGRVAAATRVGGRRWDLRLRSGVDIRLPEAAATEALATVAALDQETGLLDRAIAAIDLRDPVRPLVRPLDGGALTPLAPPSGPPGAG